MAKILTIEREYGSGAAEIARKLADRLGWKLWDQLLTDEIARRMECDPDEIEKHGERIDLLYYRLLKSFLRGSFEGNLNVPQMQMADAEGIRQVAEQLVVAAAEEGNAVIVGRGAAYYLRDRSIPSMFSFTRRSKKGCAGCNKRVKVNRNRFNLPPLSTANGRTSSKDISKSSGLPGISST